MHCGHPGTRQEDEHLEPSKHETESVRFSGERARVVLKGAQVWRGGLESEAHERGIKILGTPLGHPDYVAHQLQLIRRH